MLCSFLVRASPRVENFSIKIKLLLLSALAVGGVILTNGSPIRAQQFEGPSLFRGDFVTIHNVTEDQPAGGWADSIDAGPGNIVEIRVVARNEGSMTADHVRVIGHVPDSQGAEHTFSATLQAPYGGGTSIADTATARIRDGSSQTFRYEEGHARIFGVTNLFNCPSGCSLSDSVASSGLEIGDIPAGESVQVTFKARMTDLVSPSPSPSPSPTPTSSPSPSPSPSSSPSPSLSPTPTPTPTPTPISGPPGPPGPPGPAGAPGASAEACVNNSCNPSANVTVNNPAAPQVLGVTSLPKTGLPSLAWSVLALIPTGLGLRKFRQIRIKKDLADKPNYIWEDRKFKVG